MGKQPRSLVQNAADPKQVARANRVIADREDRFLASLQVILASSEGRIVLWHLLREAGIFRSIWDPSAKIHYNAGQQDFGHMLLAKCIEASPELYQLMEREARERQRHEEDGTAAVQQRADDGGASDG